jgi:hypothetical protein
MYAKGDGLTIDKSRALDLLGRACDLKNQSGCDDYAILKSRGLN